MRYLPGIAMLLLGLVHCGFTFAVYRSVTDAALWFFGTGLALCYAAILNLLHADRGGLRIVTLTVNLSLLAFALVYSGRRPMATLRNPPALVLLVTLAAAAWQSGSSKR